MPKYNVLSEQLKNRILQGDYAIQGLPAERQLAVDSGVSYMTARRALQQLIDEGLLLRGSNGRVEVKRGGGSEGTTLQIAFLAPSFPSASIDRWRNRIVQAAEKSSVLVRPLFYTHWDDPIIASTLDSFDGVFLLPTCEPIPALVMKRFQEMKRPLVVLEDDLTPFGIPTIRHSSPAYVQFLLDHLEAQGFREIHCFNVQPKYGIAEQRIAQWQLWMAAHHYTGQLYDNPVQPYDDTLPHSYQVVKKLLAEGHFRSGAILCITIAAAMGANRAMHEAGIRSGVDVAICVVGGEGLAALQVPSITALEAPDITPYLTLSLDWMANGGGAWRGPLLMQPEALLVVRESTTLSRNPEFQHPGNPACSKTSAPQFSMAPQSISTQQENHAELLIR